MTDEEFEAMNKEFDALDPIAGPIFDKRQLTERCDGIFDGGVVLLINAADGLRQAWFKMAEQGAGTEDLMRAVQDAIIMAQEGLLLVSLDKREPRPGILTLLPDGSWRREPMNTLPID